MDNSLGKFNRNPSSRRADNLNEKRNAIEITRELYRDQNKNKLKKEEEIERLKREMADLSQKQKKNDGIKRDKVKEIEKALGYVPPLGEADKEAEKLKRKMEEKEKRLKDLEDLDKNITPEDLELRRQEMEEAGARGTGERVIPPEHRIAFTTKEKTVNEDDEWKKQADKFQYGKNAEGFTPEEWDVRAKEIREKARRGVDDDEWKKQAEKFQYGNNTGTFTQEEWDARAREIREKSRKKPGEVFYPTVPVEPSEGKIKRKLNVISVDEIVKGAAWRQAEEKVRQLLHSPEEGMKSNSRVKSILNNIGASVKGMFTGKFWKKSWVRMAEAGYKEKYYKEALKQITGNQNLMVELENSYRIGRPLNVKDPNVKRNEHYAVLAKVLEEYSNNAAEMEERGNKITDPRVDEKFQKLIYAYQLSCLKGKGWTRDQFENVQRKYINRLKNQGLITDTDFLGTGAAAMGGARDVSEVKEGRMYATNLYDIAQEYKDHVGNSLELIAGENKLTPEQKEKLGEHIQSTLELDIELGAKLSDVMNQRPAGTFGSLDKFIGVLQRTPILRRIASNPGSAAILGCVGSHLFSKGLVKAGIMGAATVAGLATGAWAPILGAAITAGAFGAIRRNRELKADRAMHQRQKTLGKEYQDFRRGNLDRFQYDVKSAADLGGELDTIIASGKSYADLDPTQQSTLASIFARFKVELARDREFRLHGGKNVTVDLITATQEEGEKYQTNYMSKTDLKMKLYQFLESNHLIDSATKIPTNDFMALTISKMRELNSNIEGADKAFNRHRRRSAAAVGALAGVSATIGVGAGQEAMKHVSNWLGLGDRVTAWDTMFNRDKLHPEVTGVALLFDTKGASTEKINQVSEIMSHLEKKPDGSINASKLPAGWRLVEKEGKFSLIHDFTSEAHVAETIPTDNWNDFVKSLGQENSQRVSYQGFLYQGTPPEAGIRAMVENARNLANNLKLNADSTELAMQFKDGGDGSVIVDASKMFGKELKAEMASKGVKMEDVLKKDGKFYLSLAADNSNAPDGSQFNPILLEMQENGTIKVSKDIAKHFFEFDKEGKLVQGPGYGLKQLVMDTGTKRGRDGAMIVEGISARLGEAPKMEVPVTVTESIPKTEEFPLEYLPGHVQEYGTPWAIGPAGASRWQLESERKEGQKAERNKKTGTDEQKAIDVEVIPEPEGSSRASEEEKKGKTEGEGMAEENSGTEEAEKAKTETSGKNEEDVKKGRFNINKREGKIAWREFKHLFEDLGVTIGRYNFKDVERLNADITNVLREEQKNVTNSTVKNNFPAQRKEIEKIYEHFQYVHKTALTLPQFVYCLKRRLREYLKDEINQGESLGS